MARTLEAIRRKINTAEDLQSIVRTMKGLAAANIRQFLRAVESLGEYRRTIELGFQALLKEGPGPVVLAKGESAERLAAILFGTDQGMCGRFNHQVVSHALAEMERFGVPTERRTILAVGGLIVPLLELAGQPVAEQLTPPSSAAAITHLVQEVLLRVEGWHESQEVAHVVLFYNESLGSAVYRPHTHPLVPVDMEWLGRLQQEKWESRSAPLVTMEWRRLLSTLLRQHFFIELYRASAESLASENASRLGSMQRAERNIDERLEELTRDFRHQRQTSITEELFDIIAGFEALRRQ